MKRIILAAILMLIFFGTAVTAFAAEKIRNDNLQPMGPPSKASEFFYKAVKNNNLEMMDTYLARGADINCGNCDNSAKPPLAWALTDTYFGKPSTVEYLVKHGADVNLLTQGRMAPLMFALMGSSRETMKTNVVLLVENGANVQLKNNVGNNALIMLSSKGYGPYDSDDVLRMMQLLIKKGTDVNHQNTEGKSALMFSAAGCGIPSVQLLLSLRANSSLKSATGETALSLAEEAAANSSAGSNCNQVVAMLRNPDQYMTNPLSNSDVYGPSGTASGGGAPRSLPPPPKPDEAIQGLFNGIGKLLGK